MSGCQGKKGVNYLVDMLINHTLTALNLQWAGLGVQGEAAEVHVAHGSDSDSAVKDTVKNIHCNLTF